jgi:alkylation response protein AidB-like acyl-CoA dehydrogenase
MQFQPDEMQAMIRESVAAFTRDHVREQAMAWNEQPGRDEHSDAAARALTKLGELGLLGVLVPEEAGGAGMGALELAVALEELAVGDAGLAAAVAMHNAGALGWLMRAGDSHKQLIAELATGAKIGCAGHVSGPTIGAKMADVLVLPGAPSQVVDLRADGVVVEPFAMLGLRMGGAARVVFEGAEPEPAASDDKEQVNGLVRIAAAAIAVGIGSRALQAGVQYSLQRQQFGKPIARFQALQWMTADAATELETARLLTRRAAWLHDAGKPFADAAARACHLSTNHARKITDRALQMHGGYGYTEDFPVERLYRDAYSLHALTGRTDLAKIEIAQSLARAL